MNFSGKFKNITAEYTQYQYAIVLAPGIMIDLHQLISRAELKAKANFPSFFSGPVSCFTYLIFCLEDEK